MRKMRAAACGFLAALITCVSSGCGVAPPKGRQVNEPADVLAAIKQCGADTHRRAGILACHVSAVEICDLVGQQRPDEARGATSHVTSRISSFEN